MGAGFTTDDRITSFHDISHEKTPPLPPIKPTPRPKKKTNSNLFGFHPNINPQTKDEFIKQQNIALLHDNQTVKLHPDNISDTSSVNRIDANYGNTRHHPKYFKNGNVSIQSAEIDQISSKNKIYAMLCILI